MLLYNKYIQGFISNYLPKYEKMNAFDYFDTPYYHKGRQLYLNFLHIMIMLKSGNQL